MWLNKLFKKKIQPEKTCKNCGYNSITGTKRYDFLVLVCACTKTNKPISVASYKKDLDYTKPKWCLKR